MTAARAAIQRYPLTDERDARSHAAVRRPVSPLRRSCGVCHNDREEMAVSPREPGNCSTPFSDGQHDPVGAPVAAPWRTRIAHPFGCGNPGRWSEGVDGGDEGTRTPDPLLAKEVLSQLSYIPTSGPNRISRSLIAE